MIHPYRSFYIEPGLGDFIWHLALIESYGKACVLEGPAWYGGKGLEKLAMTLLPNVKKVRFGNFGWPWWWEFTYGEHDWNSCACTYLGRRWGIKPQVVLSRDAVDRLPAYPKRERLLVHPTASGDYKNWNGWGGLDLSPYDVMAVGRAEDPRPIDLPIFSQDYFSLARLLVASKGLLCVNSSVFALARLLGVPTVLICMDDISYKCYGGLGINLLRPGPAEVQEAVDKMMKEGHEWKNGR